MHDSLLFKVRFARCRYSAIGALSAGALVLAPLVSGAALSGCAMPESMGGGSLQSQQASACGGLGAGVNATDTGVVAGAIGGGVLGNLFSNSRDKLVGTILGAGAGAAIGGFIGSKLDAEDCASLTAELDRSLQYNTDGEGSDWSASKANVNAHFVPSHTYYQTRTVTIQRASGVSAPGPMTVIGRIGYATESADILSSPLAGSGSVGALAPGDAIRIIGRPQSAPGYDLIARGGIAVGYVRTADISHRAPSGTSASTAQNLATVAPIRPASDLNGVSGDDTDQVTATEECRSVSTTVSGSDAGSKPNSTTTTACQTPDGVWNLQDYGGAS